MSSKPSTFNMAQTAIFNHAAAFSPFWGESEQTDNGIVLFKALPEELKTLCVKPQINRRWMGGTCAMNIMVFHQTDHSGIGELEFKGGKGGRFTGKTEGEFSANLRAELDADAELKQRLLSIDLEALTIHIKNGRVETTLTPYGGGMAYMVIPPMRTPIPLPPEQIKPITQVLEKISHYIEKSK